MLFFSRVVAVSSTIFGPSLCHGFSFFRESGIVLSWGDYYGLSHLLEDMGA